MEIYLWLEPARQLEPDKPIRVGLSSPTPNNLGRIIVHQSPIFASGRVEGLPAGKQYWIQGFVIANREWPQGSGEIQEDGSWKIDAIFLGAVDHQLFFRIFDKDDTMIA